MANQTNETKGNNSIASALRVFAWFIIIGGFIAGIVLARVEITTRFGDYTKWSFALALPYWATSFIAGLVYLGFAEIITLLQKLVNSGSRTLILPVGEETKVKTEPFSDLPKL